MVFSGDREMKTQFAKLLFVLISVAILFGCGWGGKSSNISGSDTVPQYADAATALAEGNKFLDANKTQLAIEAYKQATSLDPNLAEAYFQLGVAYSLVEMEEREERKEDVNAGNASTKAVKTESQKAFEAAIDAYKKIVDANSEDAAAHFNLGRAYAKLDKDADAEREIRAAMKINPDENEYRVELGDVLMKLAKYSDALAVYTRAFEVDPENFDLEEKIEDARAGRKRQTFTGPSPSPTPSPSPSSEDGAEPSKTPDKKPEATKTPGKK